ncbi:uncharacterized protein LOC130691713 [Daphnia carinata]|uniref:uncharacterized protein LOC130691713 n=1 Tax=Daphnia carinata TaxID=120202 RepID=UPI00257D48C2|nr:uncharacterized protein LOC130691713 [Daphnia carinata]
MAGSDGAILLTTARWSGSSGSGSSGQCEDSPHVYLHDVVKSGELPQLVRIVKGSYLGLGAPSLPNPSLSSTALVASAGVSLRLAVQCLKFKDNHKTVNVGPKLAIPETFDGYFEILNEDGRAVRGIESVNELARKFPDSCLVRQNIKVFYQQSTDSSAKSADHVCHNITERSRTLNAGELLVLVGEVSSGGLLSPSSAGQRYLRCLDSRGDHVYLPMDMRAKFSAVAKEDNQQGISGVHRIRALLNKRLPLTVRMVSGSPPAGLKIGQQFCYEMRLLASFKEEMIVAMPLGVNQAKTSTDGPGVVIIPPTVSLKLQLPVNRQTLKATKEFARMTERCLHQYGLLSDRIQVYDAHFSKNLRFDGQHWRVPVPLLLAPLRRSTSDLIQSITGHGGNRKHSPESSMNVLQSLTTEELPEADEDGQQDELPVEYDEIDQIYDYIRGFAPLPKNLKTSSSTYDIFNESNRSNRKSEQRRNLYNKMVVGKNTSEYSHQQKIPVNASQKCKPVPPPLETIPTHRNRINSHSKEVISSAVSTEKEEQVHNNSTAVTSIAVNHGASSPEPVAKPRMYRQRSALAAGAAPSAAVQRLYSKNPAAVVIHRSPGMLSPAESKQSLTPSPLFNIRYKSMTNLLAASAADSDTLGSSQSGGRCSGGSAGSAAVRSPHHPNQQRLHHHAQKQHYARQVSAPPVSQHRLFQLHRPRSLTDLLWGRNSESQRNNRSANTKSPLKIQLHPTVVADVIPSSSSRTSGPKREVAGRRRHSGSNHLLNTAAGNGSSSTTTKKHTIFYHL